jgi:hypothetical protein
MTALTHDGIQEAGLPWMAPIDCFILLLWSSHKFSLLKSKSFALLLSTMVFCADDRQWSSGPLVVGITVITSGILTI